MQIELACVITTIQSPTTAMRDLSARLSSRMEMVVIGDRKGPENYPLPRVRFHSLAAQFEMPYQLARALPVGHYSRKNLGYLEAIAAQSSCIYETDDDNAPNDCWTGRQESTTCNRVQEIGWVNVYRCFTNERIWPRGLPLDEVVASCKRPVRLEQNAVPIRAPIQQGLANGAADVDAVWRLVLDRPFEFDDGPSVVLPPGAWCPFNSQSTWWWPDVYPLMYLPSFCSFRMTDIWRSFIAQRCLWELGLGVVFHAAEVVQDRNQHNLMRDFADEIPGYQRNRELVQVLADTALLPGLGAVSDNLQRCYEALVKTDFFAREELHLLAGWRAGLDTANRGH